jgi:hypothetical protein
MHEVSRISFTSVTQLELHFIASSNYVLIENVKVAQLVDMFPVGSKIRWARATDLALGRCLPTMEVQVCDKVMSNLW